MSCNPTNKSISVFSFSISFLLLPQLPKIYRFCRHQQASLNLKLNHREVVKAFGELRNDCDFGFVTRSRHNGSTGSSLFLCSSTLSQLPPSTMASQNSLQTFYVSNFFTQKQFLMSLNEFFIFSLD